MVLNTVLSLSVVSTALLQSGAFEAPLAAELFLFGRILFGGILAFNGLNHFLDLEAMTEYAASKGVPRPRFAVVFTGGMLIIGGLGIVLGVFPTFTAGTLAVFLLVVTPIMHNFWAMPRDQQEQEVFHFMKNTALLGGALLLLALSATAWPYALLS